MGRWTRKVYTQDPAYNATHHSIQRSRCPKDWLNINGIQVMSVKHLFSRPRCIAAERPDANDTRLQQKLPVQAQHVCCAGWAGCVGCICNAALTTSHLLTRPRQQPSPRFDACHRTCRTSRPATALRLQPNMQLLRCGALAVVRAAETRETESWACDRCSRVMSLRCKDCCVAQLPLPHSVRCKAVCNMRRHVPAGFPHVWAF